MRDQVLAMLALRLLRRLIYVPGVNGTDTKASTKVSVWLRSLVCLGCSVRAALPSVGQCEKQGLWQAQVLK